MTADRGRTQVAIELHMRMELDANAVWPDGLPDVIDADAVIVACEESGTASRFISDWNADCNGASVEAVVDGKYARGWLR